MKAHYVTQSAQLPTHFVGLKVVAALRQCRRFHKLTRLKAFTFDDSDNGVS